MDHAVRAKVAIHDIDLTSEIRHAHVIPATLICEAREDLLGWIVVTKDPKRNENDEEARDVAEEACDFKLRKDW